MYQKDSRKSKQGHDLLDGNKQASELPSKNTQQTSELTSRDCTAHHKILKCNEVDPLPKGTQSADPILSIGPFLETGNPTRTYIDQIYRFKTVCRVSPFFPWPTHMDSETPCHMQRATFHGAAEVPPDVESWSHWLKDWMEMQ